MTDVREINQIEALGDYRAVWRSLLEETPHATFFYSLEWLEIYWRHFGAGQKLRVLVVSSGGQPIGILPLVVLAERTKIGRMRMLTYPLHDWGSFYGPLGPDPVRTLTAGLEYIRDSRRDWDAIELRWSGAASSDRQQAGGAMRAAGLQAYQTLWNRTAVVDLADGWEGYLASRSAKWLHNVDRLERRLSRQGELTHVRHRPRGAAVGDADPRWDLYDACEDLARRSWQGSSTTGTTLSHASIRPFLREVHAAAAECGAVDLNLLLLGGQPLAFVYNYCWHGSVYGLRAGYDATLSRDGPGNVLYLRILRDSCQRNDRFYDLGVGSLPAKRHLLSRTLPIFRFGHYPLSVPRAQVLRLRRWMQQRTASACCDEG